MALIVVVFAFILDLLSDQKGVVFMFSLPFIVFLITGKQYNDRKKQA